jgi:hypothetical protein
MSLRRRSRKTEEQQLTNMYTHRRETEHPPSTTIIKNK